MQFSDEMKELFSFCVDGVIELIEDQIDKVRKDKHRRVKVKCDYNDL